MEEIHSSKILLTAYNSTLRVKEGENIFLQNAANCL
jgi:hypothetical protein